jgi:hypothetical protein
MLSDGSGCRTAIHVTWEIQKFSNAVFDYMHRNHACSSLKVLVVGTHFVAGLDAMMEEDMCLYPRHCFVKGYQTDVLSRSTTIAVPVPAYRIRELEPDCDLLDYDPECNWVGGLPGRLRLV